MAPQDIWKEVRRKPFMPFRITLTEGGTYEVRHPEFCLVSLNSVNIGLPMSGDPDSFAQKIVTIDVSHVVKLEPLDVPVKG
jgi:hypothetical protein